MIFPGRGVHLRTSLTRRTAAAYFKGKKDLYLPAESELTFRLAQPVFINDKG
jgi:hypothetical protein